MKNNRTIMRAANLMEGCKINETAILRNQKIGEELHFWGLSNGQTLLIKRIGRRWVSATRVPEPIGIARHRYRVGGKVRDHEWSATKIRNEVLKKSPTLMAEAAAKAKQHDKMLPDE